MSASNAPKLIPRNPYGTSVVFAGIDKTQLPPPKSNLGAISSSLVFFLARKSAAGLQQPATFFDSPIQNTGAPHPPITTHPKPGSTTTPPPLPPDTDLTLTNVMGVVVPSISNRNTRTSAGTVKPTISSTFGRWGGGRRREERLRAPSTCERTGGPIWLGRRRNPARSHGGGGECNTPRGWRGCTQASRDQARRKKEPRRVCTPRGWEPRRHSTRIGPP